MKALLLILLALTFSGCIELPKPGSKCNVAENQKDSFLGLGAIKTLPVTVFIQKNTSKEDVKAIGQAIYVWNDFAQNYGRRLFNYKYLSPTAKEVDGIEVLADPMLPTLGKTTRRFVGDGVNPAKIAIQYQQGLSTEDLAWVMIHELSHALGLDHSCHPSKHSKTFTSCYAIERHYDALDFDNASHPYVASIMYPNIVKINGNTKYWQTVAPMLDQNTIDRAYCLLFSPDLKY